NNVSYIIHYASTSPAFSAASFVKITLSYSTKSKTLSSSIEITLADFKLFAERITFSFFDSVMINAFSFTFSASNNWTTSLVLGCSNCKSSSTSKLSPCTFEDEADFNAKRRTFLGSFVLQFLAVVGPNTTPPPTHCGERVEPWRALPVPFCLHGFLPPPRTSPLFFTA